MVRDFDSSRSSGKLRDSPRSADKHRDIQRGRTKKEDAVCDNGTLP